MNKFGLTTEEASKALSEQGNNALTQPPRETFWDKLWENFKDPIIRILILALLVNVVLFIWGTATGSKRWVFSGHHSGDFCFYLF